MRALRVWLARLAGLLGGARRDADLSAEQAAHLQLHIDDNLRRGMTPAEARRDALLKLGGLEQVKEQTRDRRGLPGVDMLGRDVRVAARALRATPGFTATVLMTLALGMGGSIAIFTIVNAVYVRQLPCPEAGHIYVMRSTIPHGTPTGVITPRHLATFMETTDHPMVQAAALAWSQPSTIVGADGRPNATLRYGPTLL